MKRIEAVRRNANVVSLKAAQAIYPALAQTVVEMGIAPQAVGVSFGDSVQLLEAVEFIFNQAGNRPCVVNLSLGTNGGPHDGSTLVEQGLDALVRAQPNRAIVIAASNSQEDSTPGRLGDDLLSSLKSGGGVDEISRHLGPILRLTPRLQTALHQQSLSGASYTRGALGRSPACACRDGCARRASHPGGAASATGPA